MSALTTGRRGSVRKAANGSWYFVIDVTPPGASRRSQTRRRGFATKAAAQGALSETMATLAGKSYVRPSRQTLGDYLIESWLPAVAPTLRRSTWESYRRVVRVHVGRQPTAQTYLQAVDAPALNRLYADLLAGRGMRRALAPRTVQYLHAILHRAFRDAVRWNVLMQNPADLADPPRPKAHQRRPLVTWTASELRSFLTAMAADRLFALWYLYASTACRRSEVLALRWSDVDLEAGRITVSRTLVEVEPEAPGEPGWMWSTPKTDSGRRLVALDRGSVDVLRQHRALQLEERMRAGASWRHQSLVFCEPDGTPLHPKTVSTRFTSSVRQLGLPYLSLHGLRHTWATLALGQNVHPRIVQERLGHSNVAVTLNIYSHVSPVMHAEAAETVAALLVPSGTSSQARS